MLFTKCENTESGFFVAVTWIHIKKDGGETMAGNFEGIKTRRFGVEIEMTGITRCAAARAIQKVLGGSISHDGG